MVESPDIIAMDWFDFATIEQAKKILTGQDKRYHFDAQGVLHDTWLNKNGSLKAKHLDSIDGSWDPGKKDHAVVGALMGLLAQATLSSAPREEFNAAVKVRATSFKDLSWGGAELVDSAFFFDPEHSDYEARGMSRTEARLEALYERLNDLANWQIGAGPTEEELREQSMGSTAEFSHRYLYYRGEGIMKGCIELAKLIRADGDYEQYGNQFPESVKFIRNIQEAEFLARGDGGQRVIADPANFFASHQDQMASKLDIQVDPILISRAREQALGRGKQS